jgi:hypothetical protein
MRLERSHGPSDSAGSGADHEDAQHFVVERDLVVQLGLNSRQRVAHHVVGPFFRLGFEICRCSQPDRRAQRQHAEGRLRNAAQSRRQDRGRLRIGLREMVCAKQ